MNKWIASFAIVASAVLFTPAFAGDGAAAYQNALQSASLSLLSYLDEFKLPVMLLLGLLAFRLR
jgi:hypothetical protein